MDIFFDVLVCLFYFLYMVYFVFYMTLFFASIQSFNNQVRRHLTSFRLFSAFQGYEHAAEKASAYENAKASNIPMPVIILVNPFLDQNVGSVARAMLNFGLTELRVVSPECNVTSTQAIAVSSGADDILKNAKLYETLTHAISDLQRVFATTVRLRNMNKLIYTPRGAAEIIVNQSIPTSADQSSNIKYGVVFGSETNGLRNQEVYIFFSNFSLIPSTTGGVV
jgi:tRNA(Leu) C34 or U34 (ribose-2'-O)-methylase TrmL